MKKVSLWLLCAFLFTQTKAQQIPPDGVYLVEKLYENKSKPVLKTGNALVQYNPLFVEEAPEEYSPVLISTNQFVPLVTSQSPVIRKNKNGSQSVYLQLADPGKTALELFTRKHLKKYAVILLNGKVTRIVRVGELVNSGVVQVAGCSEKACAEVLSRFKENTRSF